jgi:hypothetical protein
VHPSRSGFDQEIYFGHMRIIVALSFAARLMAQPAIDFSYAGYGGGGVPTPAVPAVISVRPSGGDDTALLEGALDHVAAMPPRDSGFRGAILLLPGCYRVSGRLEMRASGVVLWKPASGCTGSSLGPTQTASLYEMYNVHCGNSTVPSASGTGVSGRISFPGNSRHEQLI